MATSRLTILSGVTQEYGLRITGDDGLYLPELDDVDIKFQLYIRNTVIFEKSLERLSPLTWRLLLMPEDTESLNVTGTLKWRMRGLFIDGSIMALGDGLTKTS